MEIWKDVLGYEGLYMVSSLGRVKPVKTGLIMKHSDSGCGYKKYLYVKWEIQDSIHSQACSRGIHRGYT